MATYLPRMALRPDMTFGPPQGDYRLASNPYQQPVQTMIGGGRGMLGPTDMSGPSGVGFGMMPRAGESPGVLGTRFNAAGQSGPPIGGGMGGGMNLGALLQILQPFLMRLFQQPQFGGGQQWQGGGEALNTAGIPGMPGPAGQPMQQWPSGGYMNGDTLGVRMPIQPINHPGPPMPSQPMLPTGAPTQPYMPGPTAAQPYAPRPAPISSPGVSPQLTNPANRLWG